MAWFFEKSRKGMCDRWLGSLVIRAAEESLKRICSTPKKVLLLPPDITRAHSEAGAITYVLYHFFTQMADVYVMPALG
jgi:hypothetical protein